MSDGSVEISPLFRPLTLPCGVTLKNRIIKSAMSDSLGDGTGLPTAEQQRLYARWARGGLAASIIGEVQGSGAFAEKPGNLVLSLDQVSASFRDLAAAGTADGAQLWLQLGHAGAMAHAPISNPKGPSALDLPKLRCEALSPDEINALPEQFANTAALAKDFGFGGVQIHAAHGFLLSQFLSPLFNKRADAYGGSLEGRMRLTLEVIEAVRHAVGQDFPVAIKINATDQLEGGFMQEEALELVAALDQTSIDLIDISGGTYFPGAKSAFDSAGSGPYFLPFAEKARKQTSKPLMVTGGFKTRTEAEEAITLGKADVVGLARALVIDPELPQKWKVDPNYDPVFPRFEAPPEGGITAWYTMRMTDWASGEDREALGLRDAISTYEARDREREPRWNARFTREP
ncbi:NADH:flavin oxidoreductase/NADH oxidase family protein [uncultured Cohaesibacter sp.]|uniref:NADH:flavin oxidoreductase/NADH oxidase family protein n=1 Tax=uncultured Cohaesibacter sp. TaxID=1002546 RepID=UPI0029C68034|nr:NADH:flavin oxidoreductase/NADH oxidase family protein [uncultured Cohaesibacter sp.]